MACSRDNRLIVLVQCLLSCIIYENACHTLVTLITLSFTCRLNYFEVHKLSKTVHNVKCQHLRRNCSTPKHDITEFNEM